jgi:hypothetical protein
MEDEEVHASGFGHTPNISQSTRSAQSCSQAHRRDAVCTPAGKAIVATAPCSCVTPDSAHQGAATGTDCPHTHVHHPVPPLLM